MREFDNLTSFCLHFATVAFAIHEFEQRGLEKVASLIQKDAKQRIGEYQEQEGPFPAWADLADSTEYEKARLGFATDAPLLRTGELRESIEKEVKRSEAIIGSKMDIAEYQEFGTNKIPPRPFIGPAAFSNKDKIERLLGSIMVEGLTGGQKVHESLGYDF